RDLRRIPTCKVMAAALLNRFDIPADGPMVRQDYELMGLVSDRFRRRTKPIERPAGRRPGWGNEARQARHAAILRVIQDKGPMTTEQMAAALRSDCGIECTAATVVTDYQLLGVGLARNRKSEWKAVDRLAEWFGSRADALAFM